ncbi:MAG: FKBP-type peptidyl-prolyl cis-trans isomerase [Bacteroidales bacterium]|jgi:FKBP-type peptidyl-prolyl cis-trans isomerase|nr:FKBP-type peptidyl-prolyl cis-trans isomerase [Bacteroidales bacterium]
MNSLKQATCSVFAAAALMVLGSCGSKPNYSVSLKSDVDSASYYIGYFYAKQLSGIGSDLNIDAIAKGWKDSQEKVKLTETDEQVNTFMQRFFTEAQNRANENNLKEGQAFLEKNKKEQGVVTMPDGLQYSIIQEGTGVKPEENDAVQVVYHGTLIDETVFDSSKDRNDTATFNVNGVVPGFSNALKMMNEGSIWKVFIPSELGYGEHVDPRSGIKPNSVLIFEINLVKVVKKEAVEEESKK